MLAMTRNEIFLAFHHICMWQQSGARLMECGPDESIYLLPIEKSALATRR